MPEAREAPGAVLQEGSDVRVRALHRDGPQGALHRPRGEGVDGEKGEREQSQDRISDFSDS